MKIYHNPRCRKSRETLSILEDQKAKFEIVLYLDSPPSVKELKDILKKLDLSVHDIIRKGEKLYKEEFKGQDLTDAQWLKVLSKNPKLIERPIVVKGKKAVIGRPPENVHDLL